MKVLIMYKHAVRDVLSFSKKEKEFYKEKRGTVKKIECKIRYTIQAQYTIVFFELGISNALSPIA